MSFTLTYRLPPLATLKDGVGHTFGKAEGPVQVVPLLGAFSLTLQVGTNSLPPAMAGELAHRRKWRAELCCARFLNQDLDRAKILMALKVTDAQGRIVSAMGPCGRWFHGKDAHGLQRTLPPSASNGGRPLVIKAAWGSDGNLRSDPVAGEAYTLHCRLAPLEGVGRDGSIELFEDEEEMTAAFAPWSEAPVNPAAASAAASESFSDLPLNIRRSATSPAAASPALPTRSSARRHSPSLSAAAMPKTEHDDSDDDGQGAGAGAGESFVVRVPYHHHHQHRSAAAATTVHAAPPLPNVPGGGKMPAPSPRRGGAAASAASAGSAAASPSGVGGKRRRGAASAAAASPPSSSDTDGSLCSSCGGGVGVWKGVVGGGRGGLAVPTVEQLMRFGYAELRELQSVVGQAMDRLYEEEALCPVCLHKERVVACAPCGHRFCEDDAAKLIDGKCHVCSKRVTQRLRLY